MAETLYRRDLLRWSAQLYRWPLDGASGPQYSMTAQPCGSAITLALDFDNDGHIAALGMDCQSCAFGQASAAIMAHYVAGHALDAARDMASKLSQILQGAPLAQDITENYPEFSLLAVAAPYMARHPAIMLPYKALSAYQSDIP